MRTILLATCLILAFSVQAQADNTTGNPPATGMATDNSVAAPDAQTPATDEEATTTDEENTGPLTATDKIVNRFMELDTDTSEGVSFDEYMVMVQQRAKDRFASMDANKDGEVTADEYREFWKARKAEYYRPKR